MIKDVAKGAGWTVLLISSFALLGWSLGEIASRYIFDRTERPIWYCIEGKVYEKVSDTYVTVSPARSCLPVIKE